MTLQFKDTSYHIDFGFALTVTLMLLFFNEETVILSLMSSILHEFGHLLFMHIFHQKVESVTLGAFGVRIQRCSNAFISYKKETIIALGGIMINFLIAIQGGLYYYLRGSNFSLKLALVNTLIALFNSIPIEVLDMGRAVRCILMMFIDETDSDRILRFISLVSVNLLMAISIYYSIMAEFNPSLIAVTVYLYIITLIKKWS